MIINYVTTKVKASLLSKMFFAISAFFMLGASHISLASPDSETLEKPEKASRVVIEWVEPKKFRDTRSSTGSSAKHREHIFNQLEEHLSELAETLPKGQSLKLSVTDLDLAGRVEPGSFTGLVNTMNDVRIVRQIDIPRMKFNYELLDASGNIIQSDEVKLKDMNFLSGVTIRHRERPFAYEKRMITKWFEQNLVESKS